ncbi:hypothetical protein UFOVP180_26 [uncultured Caudovirales phage]|uniref:Uncharacterized protein n=1 Tax=uncultured Caudovirales phage TaxID=2100421 RepID=A0A6J7WFX1_9CAUD|nr:hypothetical protein UFOVP180_26 [uncultured Caudovirales phage]
MTYQPNFNDPRIRRRTIQALSFATAMLSPNSSQWVSKALIDKPEHFGQSQNVLSKYLRSKLLVCTDPTFSKQTGKCKEYKLNQTGVDELSQYLGIDPKSVVDGGPLFEKYRDQLETGNFEYNDKSSRLHHALQHVRRDAKKQGLAKFGYKYNYDIKCCAVTLIHQHAQRLGMDSYLFALREFMTKRTEIRNRIAKELEIDAKTAKILLTALLQGSYISHSPKTNVYKAVGGDHSKIEWLKQDEWLTEFRGDIKECWSYIIPHMSYRTMIDKNNRTRRVPVNGKQKSALYRDLERGVLDSVRTYLNNTDNKHLAEHDGWSCQKEIDIEELSSYVKTQTGFEIEIEFEVIELENH